MEVIKKSKLKIKEITKIVQISDVHIRNFKRHKEYNDVFEKVYSWVAKNSDDKTLIVLTGDIVHSKLDITPELVQMTQQFLNNLASICPTLLIPGNHDLSLRNTDRLDSLTPIVDALDLENLEYVKESCILELGGLHFYHWSVFDKKEQFIKPQSDDNYKICLYHGPVDDIFISVDFKMSFNSVLKSDFNGFNIGLLGDIHLPNNDVTGDGRVKYPGSLIQQSFGEEVGHGFLVWDIPSGKSEFIEVENDIAYCNVEVDGAEYKFPDKKFPKKIYLKVKYKNSNNNELKRIVSELRKTYTLLEVTYQKCDTKSTNLTRDIIRSNDLRDLKYQNSLLQNFFSTDKNHEKNIPILLNINEYLFQKISHKEEVKNYIWNPKGFWFENMFSYGKSNFIDFSKMSGTYGIFAGNAQGKTSIFQSFIFCLFDKCTKTSNGKGVINNQSNDFNCKLNFEINGVDYWIERRGLRQKSGNIRVDVDFYKIEDGVTTSLNGKDRSETNQNIRNVIGTFENFILTSLSSQDSNTGFISMGQTARKDVLSQFLDISIFDELYTYANEEIKEASILLKELSKKDYNVEIEQLKVNIKEDEERLEVLKSSRSEFEIALKDCQTNIENLNSKLVPIDDEYDVDVITTDINKIKSTISKIENSTISEFNIKLENTNQKIAKIESELSKFDENKIEQSSLELANLKRDETNFKIRLGKFNTEHSHMKSKMDKLDSLEYDENCQFCMNNIFVKDAIETRGAINIVVENIETIQSDLKIIREKIESYDWLDTAIKDLNTLNKSLYQFKTEQNSIVAQINIQKSEILKQSTRLIKLESDLKNANKNIQIIKNNNEFKSQIKSFEISRAELEDKLKSIDSKLGSLKVNIKTNNNTLDDYTNKLNSIIELEDKIYNYKLYLSAVHRDGIPNQIIANTLPLIEEEANNVLSQLVDFRLILDIDDKNINGYIVYSEDKFWPIELSSGMELFILSLAIRSALISVSNLPKPNFLWIDEGLSVMDSDNMGNFTMVLDYMKSNFKFMILISHIDRTRDFVDSIIEISKRDGRSSITF